MKKQEHYEVCSVRLKALSDPIRLRVIKCLCENSYDVSQLCELLEVEIVKLSHHLQILRRAGIVSIERQGKHIIYSLHPDVRTERKSQSEMDRIDLGCCQLDINWT